MKILVVEDDRAVRDLMVSILGDDGYEIRTVDNGVQALAVAADFRPHLVLLDGQLPGIDGWSVAGGYGRGVTSPSSS